MNKLMNVHIGIQPSQYITHRYYRNYTHRNIPEMKGITRSARKANIIFFVVLSALTLIVISISLAILQDGGW